MPEEKNIKPARKKRVPAEPTDNYKVRVDSSKMGFYLLLAGGLIILVAGLDMTFSGTISNGWSPAGRSGPGRSGSVNGPGAVVIALMLLGWLAYAWLKARGRKDHRE